MQTINNSSDTSTENSASAPHVGTSPLTHNLENAMDPYDGAEIGHSHLSDQGSFAPSPYVFDRDQPEVTHEGDYMIVVMAAPSGKGFQGHAINTFCDRLWVTADSYDEARRLAIAAARHRSA